GLPSPRSEYPAADVRRHQRAALATNARVVRPQTTGGNDGECTLALDSRVPRSRGGAGNARNRGRGHARASGPRAGAALLRVRRAVVVMAPLTFRRPSSVVEACDLLTADPWASKIISGGTAVVLMMRHGLIAPEHLVSVRDIAALHGITRTDGRLRIG